MGFKHQPLYTQSNPRRTKTTLIIWGWICKIKRNISIHRAPPYSLQHNSAGEEQPLHVPCTLAGDACFPPYVLRDSGAAPYRGDLQAREDGRLEYRVCGRQATTEEEVCVCAWAMVPGQSGSCERLGYQRIFISQWTIYFVHSWVSSDAFYYNWITIGVFHSVLLRFEVL